MTYDWIVAIRSRTLHSSSLVFGSKTTRPEILELTPGLRSMNPFISDS